MDVSVKLELNEWQGAVSPRVVLGELYPDDCEPAPAETEFPGEEEWIRRLDAERSLPLDRWPPPVLAEMAPAEQREVIDRRGASGVAAVAGVASSGAAVLALCADALRRRDLVERAALPARFGGGRVAIASGRLAEDSSRAAVADVAEAGGGVLLADWAALASDPSMAARFEHVVIVDPAPFPHLERVASAGRGFLHLAWGDAEVQLALRVHREDWPDRSAAVDLYRSLRSGIVEGPADDDSLGVALLRRALHGPGQDPRSPEVGARRLRLLEELGAVQWQPSAAPSVLRVVSSTGELEVVEAFMAYRERHEEGRRFLSERRQPS
jgi:single-stranded-DNA-specific exonuclease